MAQMLWKTDCVVSGKSKHRIVIRSLIALLVIHREEMKARSLCTGVQSCMVHSC